MRLDELDIFPLIYTAAAACCWFCLLQYSLESQHILISHAQNQKKYEGYGLDVLYFNYAEEIGHSYYGAGR
jgi:hypothetical protein